MSFIVWFGVSAEPKNKQRGGVKPPSKSPRSNSNEKLNQTDKFNGTRTENSRLRRKKGSSGTK